MKDVYVEQTGPIDWIFSVDTSTVWRVSVLVSCIVNFPANIHKVYWSSAVSFRKPDRLCVCVTELSPCNVCSSFFTVGYFTYLISCWEIHFSFQKNTIIHTHKTFCFTSSPKDQAPSCQTTDCELPCSHSWYRAFLAWVYIVAIDGQYSNICDASK